MSEPRRPHSTWLLPPVGVPVPDLGLRHEARTSGAALCTVVHVHYPEVWPEIAQRLRRIPEESDLWVSVTTNAMGLRSQIQAEFPHARFVYPDGRGRDIAPLLMLVNEGLLADYDLVLKVHTKRSTHRIDGDEWRRHMLDSLMPDAAGIRRIASVMRADPGIGLVAPDGCIGGTDSWGSNLHQVHALLSRRGQVLDPDTLEFPGGSMFWANADVIRDLGQFDIRYFEFEPELGQVDGTTAHAVERLIGLVAHQQGRVVTTAESLLASQPADPAGIRV